MNTCASPGSRIPKFNQLLFILFISARVMRDLLYRTHDEGCRIHRVVWYVVMQASHYKARGESKKKKNRKDEDETSSNV